MSRNIRCKEPNHQGDHKPLRQKWREINRTALPIIIVPTGPCLNVSCVASSFIFLWSVNGNIYNPRVTLAARIAALTFSSSGSRL
jgi:uncharacterized RDD family membrane protein YckC